MSITDATTNLSTTWTEQTTVAFTAGSLATVHECVEEVESKLQRGNLSTKSVPSINEVVRWLIRAKQELCEVKSFSWSRRYAYADTAAGTWRYALPPDYLGGDISLRDLTNDKTIPIWPQIAFDNEFPDPAGSTSDEPEVACIKGNELWLDVPAKAVYRYELNYNRSGDDNTSDDFSYLPQLDRFRCCDFAAYQSFAALRDYQAASIYKNDWNEDIVKARRSDGRKKWSGMNYHCPLWFK